MKLQPMLRYFISGLLILGFSSLQAQSKKTTTAVDTIPVRLERYGLRVGADLQKLSRSLYDKDYKGFEIVGDYRLTKKMYAAAEIGTENKNTVDEQLDFTTKGQYIRIGIDLNTYENWLDMENMIYTGFRYGYSNFSQNLNSYSIYYNTAHTNPDNIPQPTQPNLLDNTTVYPNKEFSGLSAHWVEFVAGVKAKVYNNIYIGFSARLNYLITDKKPDNFENLYIPGFNKTYDGSFGVGFNYTVSYMIPLYKKAKSKPIIIPDPKAPKAK